MESDLTEILRKAEEIKKLINEKQYNLAKKEIEKILNQYVFIEKVSYYDRGIYCAYLLNLVENEPALKDIADRLEEMRKSNLEYSLEGMNEM